MRSLLALLVVVLGGAFVHADDSEAVDLGFLRPRCVKLIEMQRAIRHESIILARRIAERKEPEPADEQQAQALADREAKVIGELRKAVKMVEYREKVLAIAEAIHQLHDDATAVQKRLGQVDLSKATLTLQDELLDDLNELLEALNDPGMS